MRKKYILILIFIGLAIIAGAFLTTGNSSYQNTNLDPRLHGNDKKDTITVTIGSTTIQAEIADTPAKQELGLSYRQSLPAGHAMLFIFNKPDYYFFWMKDMNFPLDIVWLGAGRQIIDITPNLSPSTYPQTFSPKKLTQFVLELPAGFAENNNLKIGDQANWH